MKTFLGSLDVGRPDPVLLGDVQVPVETMHATTIVQSTIRRPVVVLGIDPGFANLGFAVYDIAKEQLLEAGIITTEKSGRRQEILASSDDMARTRLLLEGLWGFTERYTIACIAYEATSLPRNASVSCKLGRAFAVIGAVAHVARCATVEFSPQDLKKRVSGSKLSSKEEVEAAVLEKPGFSKLWGLATVNAGRREHISDAAAAAWCALDSAPVRAVHGVLR